MRKVEGEQKEDQGNSTEDPEISCIRTLDARVKSTSELKELLMILKDEERVGKIQEVVEQLRKGSYPTFIREDLRKTETL